MTKKARYFERARQLVGQGKKIGEALQQIADEESATLNAVRTAYYSEARKHGMGRKPAKTRSRRLPKLPGDPVPARRNGHVDPGDATLKQLVDDLERAQARLVAYVAKREATLQELRAIVRA